MEYRRLGKSGLKVSALSFGSWVTFANQLDAKLAKECMAEAYDKGVNFFDNAETYAEGKSEEIMGKVLKELAWPRDRFIVSSKVFWGGTHPTQLGLSRKHVVEACHAALKRLQVDYLDLYFCHRPDHECPIEETAFTMDSLIRQGKILYWGTSEWSAAQIMEAYGFCRANHLIPPVMEQPQYNMFHRERFEREYKRVYETCGIGTTIWSPLASGVLTGKYTKGIPKDSRLNLEAFARFKAHHTSPEGQRKIQKAAEIEEKIAKRLGISLAQLSLLWCLRNPHVSTVILGASKVKQVTENIAALEHQDKVSADTWEEIETILQNKPEDEPKYY